MYKVIRGEDGVLRNRGEYDADGNLTKPLPMSFEEFAINNNINNNHNNNHNNENNNNIITTITIITIIITMMIITQLIMITITIRSSRSSPTASRATS